MPACNSVSGLRPGSTVRHWLASSVSQRLFDSGLEVVGGTPADMSGGEAIAVAAAAGMHAPARFDPTAGLVVGDSVTVTPSDYAQDPVAGRLVGLTQDEVVLARSDDRAGLVHVHFPRIGFHLAKAA